MRVERVLRVRRVKRVRSSFVGLEMRYVDRVVGNRRSRWLVFLFSNAFRGRQPSFGFQYLYSPFSSQAPNSHPNAEGVAEDNEGRGRPRRMSKDGIGGTTAGSAPVAKPRWPQLGGNLPLPTPPHQAWNAELGTKKPQLGEKMGGGRHSELRVPSSALKKLSKLSKLAFLHLGSHFARCTRIGPFCKNPPHRSPMFCFHRNIAEGFVI